MSATAIYRIDAGLAHTSADAAGPWSPDMQHGAAPASLVAWAVERVPVAAPMQVARMTVDLLRPVPIAPLEVRTEVVREGRKIQLCAVRLLADGIEVVRASVLRIRRAALELPDSAREVPLAVPGPQAGEPVSERFIRGNPFVAGLSIRVARGGFAIPGPAAIWYRAERPIIEGAALSPLMRAAIAGDFCNGTSSVLDFRKWTFINADLTISLAREPVGEWILLDAESWLGPAGSGIAFARLGDERGYFGRAIQSLVIEPR